MVSELGRFERCHIVFISLARKCGDALCTSIRIGAVCPTAPLLHANQSSLLHIHAELRSLLRRLCMELCQAGSSGKSGTPIVLIVEDDLEIQAILDEALVEAGFETAIASSAEEAVTLLTGKVADYRASSRTST